MWRRRALASRAHLSAWLSPSPPSSTVPSPSLLQHAPERAHGDRSVDRSAQYVPSRGLAVSTPLKPVNPHAKPRPDLWPNRGVHVFQCIDQLGIVAKISECVASRGGNILYVDLHIDLEAPSPIFYSRSEFAFDPGRWPREQMDEDFATLAARFAAHKSVLKVPRQDSNLRMALLSSWQDHCLVDLLYRWQEGELPVDITCVVSNHDRGPNTHVMRFLQRHGIPYHHVPATRADKHEDDILALVADSTDFLVLARYMQILSAGFLRGYGKDIINIHHGLLPSFKGANPYSQAHRAGVKLIGATSHFVTEDLDDGPIIEQMVDRVSHRDSLHAYAVKSENLEKQCLAKAVQYYIEHRIHRYSGNRTIVFPL